MAGTAGSGAAGRAVAVQRTQSQKSTHTAGFSTGGAGDYPGYKGRTPYPAFARPGLQLHEMYNQGSGVPRLRYCCRPGSQEAD